MPKATNLAHGRAECMLAGVTEGDEKRVPRQIMCCAVGSMAFFHCRAGVEVWVALLSPGLLFVDPRQVLAYPTLFRELKWLSLQDRAQHSHNACLKAPHKSLLSFCMWQKTF